MKKLQKNILLCFILHSFLTSSQSDKEALVWFDNITGIENIPLKSAVYYNKLYRTIKNNHIYFLDEEFHLANIKYNNQLYYDIPTKYDINSDNLVVRTITGSVIVPRKNIMFFSIDNKYHFYKVENSFYTEVLISKEVKLLRKHTKEKIKIYKSAYDYVLYKFEPKYEYKILYKEDLKAIDDKSEWVHIFPEKEEEIDKFFSSYKKMFKTSKEEFFVNLIKYINN